MIVTHPYVLKNKDRFLEELFELLRKPSISNPTGKPEDMRACAELVEKNLQAIGAKTKIIDTKGYPVVYGHIHVSDDAATVLIYGHYDVQPADPLELWTTHPFKPEIRPTDIHPDGAIFARGSCDDKGQMFMHVKAIELLQSQGDLPCNVKFMIEGEEEIGSEHLPQFLEDYKDLLAADVVLVSDTSILGPETPTITAGLRGLSYIEVEVTGPNKDLHSGVYGGAVGNPITILSKMIASLHDENNHITIPGFYDGVPTFTNEQRAKINEAPFDIEQYKNDLGVDEVYGEEGYTTFERTGIRPTLELNGIWGGYTGEGAKTVLPSVATAKISCRLVGDQDHEEIAKLLGEHLKSIAPKSVKVKVTPLHGGAPALTNIESIEYKAAEMAMKESFGVTPIPTMEGGSIPVIAEFKRILGLQSILMGFGYNSDDIHSPDEHFGVTNFLMGIQTIPLYHKYYAQLKAESGK